MKITINENQLKFLTESLSDIVYHFTNTHRLLDILNSNEFHASSNVGSKSDLDINKGKFYFFSTTRSKKHGFTSGDAKLVLNGRKLSQKYKALPIDYWQYSTNPKDYANKNDYRQAMVSKELEDRIVLDKSTIPNAISYITEIHIRVDKYDDLAVLDELQKKLDELQIPVRFYRNNKDFLQQVNPINPSDIASNKEKDEHPYTPDPFRSLLGLSDIVGLIAYNQPNVLSSIISHFELEKYPDILAYFNNRINHKYENYYSYKSFYNDDFHRTIAADVHNYRTAHDKYSIYIMKLLTDDMRKLNAKSLNDYADIKLGIKKPEQTPGSPKFVVYDVGGGSPRQLEWNRNAWYHIDPADLWRALPQHLQNNLDFVGLINDKNAKLDYVYKFLMKNVSRKFANQVFHNAELDIRKAE